MIKSCEWNTFIVEDCDEFMTVKPVCQTLCHFDSQWKVMDRLQVKIEKYPLDADAKKMMKTMTK